MNPSWCKPHVIKEEKGILFLLYIQPGASKNAVKGIHGDRLKLSVRSPPIEGAANEAVIEFLSEALRVSKSKVHLLSGETSRQKNIWVAGIDLAQALKLENR